MFYVSEIHGDYFSITDTNDNATERYNCKELLPYLRMGIEIFGLKYEKGIILLSDYAKVISDFTIVFADTSDYEDKLNGFYINGKYIPYESMVKKCLNNISDAIISNNIRSQNDFINWIKKNTEYGKTFCYKVKNCILRISNDGRTIYWDIR